MSEKITPIEIVFLEIENLIKLQLQDDKTLNKSEVEQKFKEGKGLIDSLEEDDEEQHELFRYKYHTTYANYLTICGEIDKANKQERLAKKFKKNFYEGPDNFKEENKENIQEAVEEELKKTQSALGEKETIRQIFKQLNDVTSKTFDDYKNIVKYESLLIDLVELKTSKTNEQLENQISEIKEDNQQLVSSLNRLKSLANKAAYSKRLNFMYYVLNSLYKKEILFNNIQFTEEEINKRFRELALYFHSDKINRPNTPTWFQEKHKSLSVELFNFVLEIKESLLDDLKEISQNEGYLTSHEKKANYLWKIAVDYYNASKGQWDKLKLLSKDDIEEIPSEELKLLAMDNGILAYQEYQEACKIADKSKQLKKQVKLQKNMALCLYISDKFIEAQLYAVSAIQLQLKNSQKFTQQDLIKTIKVFDKVKGDDPMADATVNTKEAEDKSDNTMALIKMVYQEISISDKKTIQDSIKSDIGLMLKADRSLVRYQTPIEVISNSKSRKEELEIRKKLNSIIVKTLEAYDKGDHQMFLEEFSGEFKTGASLFKLKKRGDFINTKNIIDTLLMYGFRSDGIAYLLYLLGEVLNSGKTKIEGKTSKDLKALATNVFDGILNEKLDTEAKTLDGHIFGLRKKSHTRGTFDKFKDYVSHIDISQENKDDSQEMPFQSRLEEIRNITRINRAIFDISDAGEEEIERAIKTIREVQDSINCNHQFVSAAKWRCEALEDLLWIISGEESSKESFEELPKLSSFTYEHISDLNKQLEQASSNQEKTQLFNSIAACYEQLAEKEDKINQLNRLNSLCYWKTAQKYYEKARKIDAEATLGYAKCLLKLSKYTQVIQLSSTSPYLTFLSEFWRFCSIAYCKQVNYQYAKENIVEALRLDNKNKLADEQRSFFKKISEKNTIE